MCPTDVQSLFAGEVSDHQVRRCLDTLRADPAWQVLEPFKRAPEWLFQMVYRPTGQPIGIAARRVSPALWRFATEPQTVILWSCRSMDAA